MVSLSRDFKPAVGPSDNLTLYTDMLFVLVMHDVFTVSEGVQLLRDVEGRKGKQSDVLTARAVRYYARTGMVQPSAGRLDGARGARLYTLTDVATLRLIWLLRSGKWSQRVGEDSLRPLHERAVWGLLIYRGAEVRRILTAKLGVIAIEHLAELSPGQEQPHDRQPVRLPAAFVVEGLAAAAHRHRRNAPALWTGMVWMDATEAAQQVTA
jgi:hypothetical protein